MAFGIMLSGLYPTPTQCNRNSLLGFIEVWTMVQMSDSSLCLSPLLSLLNIQNMGRVLHPQPLGQIAAGDASLEHGACSQEHGNYMREDGV